VGVLALTAASAISAFAQAPSPGSPSSATSRKAGHKAVLKWAPSVSAKQAGAKLRYVIRRTDGTRRPDGTTTCGKKYRKIADVNGTETSYVDHTVKANRVYCYQVSSLIGRQESVNSPMVVAVVPPDAPKK
jgi:hypothetical protein